MTGKAIPNREEELCFLRMEIDTTACGWIVYPTDRAE